MLQFPVVTLKPKDTDRRRVKPSPAERENVPGPWNLQWSESTRVSGLEQVSPVSIKLSRDRVCTSLPIVRPEAPVGRRSDLCKPSGSHSASLHPIGA